MKVQDRRAGLGPYENSNVSANQEDFKVLICCSYFVVCSNYSEGDCAFSTRFLGAILESGD